MAFGDFTVTRASTKNVLGSNGLYQSVANNVPAFEFNADGSYKGLLVEPGATNLLTYSQEFDNGAWGKQEITITPNATTAPDGTTTADLAVATAVLETHQIARAGLASGAYTASVFAKANGYDTIELLLNVGTNGALFNLTTGAITPVGTSTNVIEEYPDGWYRCSVYSSVAGTDYRIYIPTSSPFFTGDGTSGVYLWQAQLETGSVATSPIVTTGSTASRVADVVSLTGASSLIGQLTGAIYCEVDMRQIATGFRRLFGIRPQPLGANAGSSILTDGLDLLVGVYGNVITLSPTAYPAGISKYLVTYTAGDVRVYRNGVLIGSSTTAYAFTTTQSNIFLGSDDAGGGVVEHLNDHIRAFAIFTTSFTPAQAIAITTL
jgi:hypothetical protein